MFSMSAIVYGIIWAAAVEPVIQMLGLGSILTAWNIAKKPEIYDDIFIRSQSKPTKENEIEWKEEELKGWERRDK